MAQVGVDDMEKLATLRLVGDARRRLYATASELAYSYLNADGWPSTVILSFTEFEGSFWVTATSDRAHVRCLEADPRVSIAISNAGTELIGRQMISLRCIGRVHSDDATVQAMIERHVTKMGSNNREAFVKVLSSPNRVAVELIPVGVVASHDSTQLPGDGRGDLTATQVRNIRKVPPEFTTELSDD